MALNEVVINIVFLTIINAFVIENNDKVYSINDKSKSDDSNNDSPVNVFDGVYTECFVQFSYICLQNKTLLYLKELNRLNEVSVIGEYVKFVKLNNSENTIDEDIVSTAQNTEDLSLMIDKAVNNFFDNHLIRFRALGKDVLVPNKVEEFVGRKRRKGGGGGGGGGGHGGGDGGKKKMMMMAMMCMKMKLMVMLPAMMGMMGMMSFKGMMFSMMSFMISKMMLLMKILEKKGGGGGGGGGGGDGGWAAGGGGGGAWMPAGGQDYGGGGGGGGGGYDANGQWQSRSIIEGPKVSGKEEAPIISYVKPIISYNNKINYAKPMSLLKNLNDEVLKLDQMKPKSRKKRGIIDVIQNAYLYWASKMLGIGNKKYSNHPKYKVINGVKYVYYPVRNVAKVKTPKELHPNVLKPEDEPKPVIVDDFNKGEIIEGPVESRMIRKKFHKMKENVNETVDENPWE